MQFEWNLLLLKKKNRDISTTEGEEILQKFVYNANEFFHAEYREK